jgi:hypothetical protein
MRLLASLALALALVLAACGSSQPSTAAPAAVPPSLTPDCFLGDGHCRLSLDLDGDTRPDTISTVRDAACASSNDDRPCLQGFWFVLASGPTQLVGAGTALTADPTASADEEALDLEPDLGFLTLLSITHHRPDGGLNARQLLASPCAADALVLSGGDAAFLLCWSRTSARAYHLGY